MTSRTAAPTLFRVLAQQRRWTTWEIFAIHFDKAAASVVRAQPSRKPKTVTVARRTFDRWFTETWRGFPRADTCYVLEHLFGFPAEDLFRPAPVVLRPAAAPAGPEQIRAAQSIETRWATSRLSLTTAGASGWDTWELDGRRVFDGTSLAVHLQAADSLDNGGRLPVTEPDQLKEFLRPVRRGLLLGTRTADAGHQVFVLDALTARNQFRVGLGAEFTLVIPDAHQLDDLTYGIIWAIANIDDAVLADDQLLHAEHGAVEGDLPDRVGQLRDMLFGDHPAASILLARIGADVVGMASFSLLWPAAGDSHSLYLKELFVREANRRAGVAWALMAQLYEFAAQLGCSRIEWTTDRDPRSSTRHSARPRRRPRSSIARPSPPIPHRRPRRAPPATWLSTTL